jgi:hypothetical protein
MNPLEFILIAATCITGWTLLYLDTILQFIQNPKSKTTALITSFQIGMVNYGIERWYTFQLIRRRNHTRLYLSPTRTTLNSGIPGPARGFPIRLSAWWKSDIVTNLKKHNLRDYLNPQMTDFQFEKYPPTKVERGQHHHEDDIFSSDEDLDTSPLTNTNFDSPLATKLQQFKLPNYNRAEPVPLLVNATGTLGKDYVSEESKETCVDEGISRREKVSGFIAWDALKRESGVPDVVVEGSNENSEVSGNSWEKEALGAAV